MTEIIFDKSFLDGASHQLVYDICAAHKVMYSESLIFELITTDKKSQVRCFSKLPNTQYSFALLPNIGTLLRFEVENCTPCIPLFERRIQGSYIFNPELKAGTYFPQGEVANILKIWCNQVNENTKSFLQRCQVVYQFFPELIGIKYQSLALAISIARMNIATDSDLVRRIYSSILKEIPLPNALEPKSLNEQWAWFRWIQCKVLAALRIFQRYQYEVLDNPSAKIFLKAEHSMHDIDYIILGALAGTLATNDKEIIEDFKLIRSNGVIITSLNNPYKSNPY